MPDNWLHWADPTLLIGMTLFCSELRKDLFPCCAAPCDSQGSCMVADAAVAESLPWLCTFPWGKVGCSQPAPVEHFFGWIISSWHQKTWANPKEGWDGSGRYLDHVPLLPQTWHRLAKAACCRCPAPHSPVSTAGERCRKPLGYAGGFLKPAKMKCWAWGCRSCCLSPENGHLPKTCCLGLGASTSSPGVIGIWPWKSSFR